MPVSGRSHSVENHPQKAKIIEAILAGTPSRSIGTTCNPPISHTSINRYKQTVIQPMLKRSEESARILGMRDGEIVERKPLSSVPAACQAVNQAIQDAPVVSLWREKVNGLIARTEKTLDKAEAAVRVSRDADGNEVFGAPDIAIIAPLINAGWKGLEILGRATGELEPQGSGQVSIQIVCPAGPGEMPRISYAQNDGSRTIDAESEDVPDGVGIQEIGVIQR